MTMLAVLDFGIMYRVFDTAGSGCLDVASCAQSRDGIVLCCSRFVDGDTCTCTHTASRWTGAIVHLATVYPCSSTWPPQWRGGAGWIFGVDSSAAGNSAVAVSTTSYRLMGEKHANRKRPREVQT